MLFALWLGSVWQSGRAKMTPRPEANIRLETIDGRVVTRRLSNVAEPLVDHSGFYRTATGGSYHAATESLPINIHSARMPPGTVY